MSQANNTYLGVAVLIALAVSIAIFSFYLSKSEQQTDQNGVAIQQINSSLRGFIKDLEARALVQNAYRNTTLESLSDLRDQISEGINSQLSANNIKVDRLLGDINGNLTKLIKAFNATNEENRGKAIDLIVNRTIQGIKDLKLNQTKNS